MQTILTKQLNIIWVTLMLGLALILSVNSATAATKLNNGNYVAYVTNKNYTASSGTLYKCIIDGDDLSLGDLSSICSNLDSGTLNPKGGGLYAYDVAVTPDTGGDRYIYILSQSMPGYDSGFIVTACLIDPDNGNINKCSNVVNDGNFTGYSIYAANFESQNYLFIGASTANLYSYKINSDGSLSDGSAFEDGNSSNGAITAITQGLSSNSIAYYQFNDETHSNNSYIKEAVLDNGAWVDGSQVKQIDPGSASDGVRAPAGSVGMSYYVNEYGTAMLYVSGFYHNGCSNENVQFETFGIDSDGNETSLYGFGYTSNQECYYYSSENPAYYDNDIISGSTDGKSRIYMTEFDSDNGKYIYELRGLNSDTGGVMIEWLELSFDPFHIVIY